MEVQLGNDSNAQPVKVGNAIHDLIVELHKAIALSSSVRSIAHDLPISPLEVEDVIAAELVFPALAGEIIQRCNASLTLIQTLEALLREQGISTEYE